MTDLMFFHSFGELSVARVLDSWLSRDMLAWKTFHKTLSVLDASMRGISLEIQTLKMSIHPWLQVLLGWEISRSRAGGRPFALFMMSVSAV